MESKEADYQRRQSVKRKKSEEAFRQELAKETREKLKRLKEEEDQEQVFKRN